MNYSPWRKSTSSSELDCVELRWRKSSRSASSGQCVEAAHDQMCHGVQLRDSKNPDGPRIALPTTAFAGLTGLARR